VVVEELAGFVVEDLPPVGVGVDLPPGDERR
jgi:hypothetical protein